MYKCKWKHPLTACLTMLLLLTPLVLSAQDGKVTLNIRNKEVAVFIRQVEKQTRYTFVYRNSVLNPKTKVSIVCHALPVSKALEQVFTPLNVSFSFNNGTIVLVRREAPAEARTTSAHHDDSATGGRRHRVEGLITDKEGEPVIGASVFLKGTSNGTVSNVDGQFALEVPDNAVLAVSYIGYAPMEVVVKGRSNLKITMREDNAQSLNEVVVVGYGKQKKASVTAAIASVTTKDLAQTPQANVSNMLVGKMPGLIAVQRSGAPGEDASNLLVRGVSTFTDNTAPLVMIDGVERPNFDGIDPNEIESVNILKDASATAIYGVRGANGVVLITTRKGQLGQPHLS